MPNRIITLKDQTMLKDNIRTFNDNLVKRVKHSSPFCRTEVIGMNDLGEVLFREENQIVLGGAMFVLEKCWDVASPLTIESLNSIKGIGTTGPAVTRAGEKVVLFGVGTGGCGDGIGTVLDVKFYEREIFDMVPLRVTTPDQLTVEEQGQYWFKDLLMNGKTAYYLKKFDSEPQIKVLWKDGEGDEDGSEVEPGVHNTTRIEPIETFIEMILQISKKDVKEWFEMNGNIDLARVNSIGLFSAALGTVTGGAEEYKNVRLLSKLNINNEMLIYAKNLTIIYRIYTS